MTLRILSLGAGVQSTTLLRMILAGELPAVDYAIFSDTGWEPAAVYAHLKTLRAECEAAGLPMEVVSNGNLRDDALDDGKRFASMPLFLVKKNGTAAMARRQCTAEYKVKPLLAKQRELAGLLPRQRSTKRLVRTLIGISWDETQRMKDPAFPWIEHEYPLVDLRMTREDCFRWNRDHGFPPPPRSSCIGCPFHSDAEWRAIRDQPEDWADAIDFDRQLRTGRIGDLLAPSRAYLHQKRIPLEEVDIRSLEEAGQTTLLDMECEGMCGI